MEDTVEDSKSTPLDVAKSCFPEAAIYPTQLDKSSGIKYDFNFGCRVVLPPREESEPDFNVKIYDIESDTLLFNFVGKNHWVTSKKRWFCRFRIEVYDLADGKQIFQHDYDAAGRSVLIQMPVDTVGDTIAWFPYVEEFRKKHNAKVICVMGDTTANLFKDNYPDLVFVTNEVVKKEKLNESAYATYNIGLFYTDTEFDYQPYDFRYVGLQKTSAYILGVEPKEIKPKIVIRNSERPFPEKYACIAVQSTASCKYWHNPSGWYDVIDYLKSVGLRVLCIDRDFCFGTDLMWHHIPHGCEDFTGPRPFDERIQYLANCEVFIGYSSGLAWLAWAAGAPVVMISGFTHPSNEFENPYRIINKHACNSCWNDPAHIFDHKDFLWCPRHAGTNRQFECSRLISSTPVISAIQRALLDNGCAVNVQIDRRHDLSGLTLQY